MKNTSTEKRIIYTDIIKMKDIIRKILKEQVDIHSDYVGSLDDPSDAILDINIKELKLILMAAKMEGITSIDNDSLRLGGILLAIRKKVAIENEKLLSKYMFIIYFNDLDKIRYSVKNGITDNLYKGPFYMAEMEYWDDEVEEDYEYEDGECEDCDGYGVEYEECQTCYGDGTVEDEEGESEECSDCDGEGRVEHECDYCDGNGTIEKEEKIHRLNAYSRTIWAKEPIDIADFSYATDVMSNGDILKGEQNWQEEQKEYDDSYIEMDVNEIIDINSEDIVAKGEGYHFRRL